MSEGLAADPYLTLTEREARQYEETGGIPFPFDIRRLLFEYDRRGADLARALPVVEAAGAVMRHVEANQFSYDLTGGTGERLLDALAAAVRAAREPRTGEQK